MVFDFLGSFYWICFPDKVSGIPSGDNIHTTFHLPEIWEEEIPFEIFLDIPDNFITCDITMGSMEIFPGISL